MRCQIVCFAMLCAAATPSLAAGPVQYQVFDLGTLGGTSSRAWEVNNLNQVVGDSTLSGGQSRGFSWNGSMTIPGAPTGVLNYAMSINDSGTVVGGGTLAGVTGMYAVSGAQWTNLGNLGGNGGGTARAINNAGQVSGVSRNALGREEAFFWNGQMQGLGTFGGMRSEAYGINEQGDVVGFAQNSSNSARAFLWTGGSLQNVGDALVGVSYAYGVNSDRLVVGEVNAGSGYRAFLWQSGTATLLGTLGGNYSVLLDVNDAGVAVGISQIAGDVNRASYYSPDTGLVNLNSLITGANGLTLMEAWSINEVGSIAGYAKNAQGQDRAFLAIVVPAPAALFMTTCVAPMLVRRKRR